MELTITRKLQIYPTQNQVELLTRTTRAFTDACNEVSAWSMENQSIAPKEMQNSLYHNIRKNHNLPSQMTQSVLREVASKYKTVHSKNKRWTIQPKFKKQKVEWVWNKDYSIDKKTRNFKLTTLEGRQVFETEWSGNDEYKHLEKYGQATLTYKHGKWFVHIPVTIEVPDVPDESIQNVVGVDLGINFLATTYDSEGKTKFYSGKTIKHKRLNYKDRRSELQAKQTRSATKRLKEIGSRENRWMNDVNHCITKALVSTEKPTLFVLENLSGVRNATEKVRRKDRYVSVSWAFHDFAQKMKYKASLYGHKVIFVDPKYTSQACPKCGHTEKANRNRKTHTFTCKSCSYRSNDDRIGAMNLHNKGIQYRMQYSVSTSDSVGAQSTVPCEPATPGSNY